MPLVPSQQAPLITNVTPFSVIVPPHDPGTIQTGASKPGDIETLTFQFIVGWVLLIVILILANKTRVGHVIIYYSLVLIILLILVSEYTQVVPYFNAIQTIGQLDTSSSSGQTPNQFFIKTFGGF